MFAYCGNNPANNSDPAGRLWAEIWEFVKEVICETGSAMTSLSPAYAGCGSLAAVDGPLPVGDIIGLVGIGFLTIGSLGYGFYQAVDAPTSHAPKEKKNTEGTATGIKSVVGSTPATPPDPNSNGNKHSYKQISNNNRANNIAQEFGYKDAEDFKDSIVGRGNGGRFNMAIDTSSQEVELIRIKGGTIVPTGYFLKVKI